MPIVTMAGARRATAGAGAVLGMALTVMWLCATADAEVDCGAQLEAMQPCLEYVNSNTSAAPSKPCCAAFNATQVSKPVCLCQLQQAFSDPSATAIRGSNATRANLIPSLCAVSVDPTRCPALLGLAPGPAPTTTPTPSGAGADVDCSPEFDSLSPCITYVSSSDTTPPATCCSALLNVHLKKPVCLCQLLQGVNADPSATGGLNVTKALELPTICKVDGADVNNCPALLGQPVASPAASPALPGTPGPDQSATSPAVAGAPGLDAGTTSPAPEYSSSTPAVSAPPGNGVANTAPASILLVCLAAFALHCLF